jgi:hypothetical protein
MKHASVLAAMTALVASAACEKKAPAPSAFVPDAATQGASAAALPVDATALRAACEEQVTVQRAAKEQYYGHSLFQSVAPAREAAACIAQAALPGSGLTADAIRSCARAERELATRSIALWGATSEHCVLRGRLDRGSSCSVYESESAPLPAEGTRDERWRRVAVVGV